jgi:hypothetical protein
MCRKCIFIYQKRDEVTGEWRKSHNEELDMQQTWAGEKCKYNFNQKIGKRPHGKLGIHGSIVMQCIVDTVIDLWIS